MSANIVQDQTINIIISGCVKIIDKNDIYFLENHPFQNLNEDQIGHELLSDNYKSYNYRYNENNAPTIYKYQKPVIEPSLHQVYKSIRCLIYQSCEHPDYFKFDTYAFLKLLSAKVASSIIINSDKYDKASWD
jgi:hypothetical protein